MTTLAGLRSLSRYRTAVPGRCPVCGGRSVFVLSGANVREQLQCVRCRSSSRNRHVAITLCEVLAGGADIRQAATHASRGIYVADYVGPLARALADAPNVTRSGYLPDVAPGAPVNGDGATCQDLQQLQYDDASFDVVVTEDVLEHVRDPHRAFAEVRRVLRPGGTHVFTAPYTVDRPTLTRVDTSGQEDRQLMEPEWHGDAIRGRILSYRTFGYDLLDRLRADGWDVSLRLSTLALARYGVFDSIVITATAT